MTRKGWGNLDAMLKWDKKRKGYVKNCKVCNHPKKEEIERLHSLGLNNEEIMRKLKLQKDMTSVSLGRHINKHYPLSRKYNDKIRELKEEIITKNIQKHPQTKTFLLNNEEKFINQQGICTLKQQFCKHIPKRQIKTPQQTINKLTNELNTIKDEYYLQEDKIITTTTKITQCQQCQLNTIIKKLEK